MLPILCKDFILYEYQIFKAREYGADAVLLIASLLNEEKLSKMLKVVRALNMDALVEVHNEEELEKVLRTEAEIIGINNRDLKTFKVDLETTNRLVGMIPEGKIVVSESGIRSKSEIEKLDKRVDAVLIGTSLIKSKNISKKLYELV